jgi:surfeit locus 1 family protein
MIEKHIALAPTSLDSVKDSPLAAEWQTVTTQGEFDSTKQILLRNRYSEGVYGFEVLTLFTTPNEERFWVDRGWVKAGATATTAPTITLPPTSEVSITGRLRLDSSLPRGLFFALPSDGNGLISKLDAQSQLQTQNYYIDLLSGSESSLTPKVTAQLPELSDGPHMAYALQWLFFAGLVIYGRILIRRTR